jgi:hypothetical protein
MSWVVRFRAVVLVLLTTLRLPATTVGAITLAGTIDVVTRAEAPAGRYTGVDAAPPLRSVGATDEVSVNERPTPVLFVTRRLTG